MTSPPPSVTVRRAGQPSPERRGSKIPSPFRGGLGRGLKKLPHSFYLRPTVIVAKDLLGKYLVRKLGKKRLIGKIVEAEAYCEGDPASHSYRGKTKRNEVMFREGGHLYVYFTYGMHYCANVVTRKEGIGEAVLIRAVEPGEGIEVMAKNRAKRNVLSPQSAFPVRLGEPSARRARLTESYKAGGRIPQLTNGPAKVCEAFGIAREHNGIDLCGSQIFIAALHSSQSAFRNPKFSIASSTRVGIQNGREKKWRFYVKGNKFVSRF